MPVPTPITEWLRKSYPKPQVDPEWLDGCYSWITDELHMNPSTEMGKMIKTVEEQLLQSNLTDSTLQNTGLPSNISQLDNTRLRGPPVLVEIVSIMEVGHSAFSLHNTRQTRIEKADLTGLGQEDGGGEDDDDEGPIPNYSRSMLRFELSDGFVKFTAMEYRPIPEIRLGETPLGYKMLLKDVFIRRGIGFLEPKCIELKGYETEDRRIHQDADFLRALRVRMGKPPDDPQEPAPDQPAVVADVPRPQGPPPRLVPQHIVDGNKAAQPSNPTNHTFTVSPFFAPTTESVASSSTTQLPPRHATLARERFLSPARSSGIIPDNNPLKVDEEFFRDEPSPDFGEDGMEIDDAILEQIELAEKSAMQDKGKGKARADTNTGPGLFSSSGSRIPSLSSTLVGTSSTVTSGSATAASRLPSAPIKEVITIDDDDDDDDDLYCSFDEADFFDDFKENDPVQTRFRPPLDQEVISISDSD